MATTAEEVWELLRTLQPMLEEYRHRGAPYNTYNEFVIDAEYSESQLPGAVEAFWYPLTDVCDTSTKCKAYTERMHAKFLKEYELTNPDHAIAAQGVCMHVSLRLDTVCSSWLSLAFSLAKWEEITILGVLRLLTSF